MIRLLEDKIIGDIIDIEIDADMSVSTLYALETIFFLRLQLAQASGDEREPAIAALCRERCGQILAVLSEKYPSAQTVSEKIEILERIETVTLFLSNDHSYFALEEAAMLEDLPDLTCSQRLRLSWMPAIDASDCDAVIATFLPQAKDAFDIATLFDIEPFCTDAQRDAIMRLYEQQFKAALQSGDAAELGKFLIIALCWNSYPQRREQLATLSDFDDISGLEKRIFQIAAEICACIDSLTAKYEHVNLTA